MRIKGIVKVTLHLRAICARVSSLRPLEFLLRGHEQYALREALAVGLTVREI
jgi:hypothetical protein